MKAIELPINLIVVILIAVIVLLSFVGLYFSGWLSPAKSINIETAKNDACRSLLTRCYIDVNLITINNFDADEDGVVDSGIGIGDCKDSGGTAKDNLYMLCKCHYSADEDQCRDICMCKGVSISNPGPPPPPGP